MIVSRKLFKTFLACTLASAKAFAPKQPTRRWRVATNTVPTKLQAATATEIQPFVMHPIDYSAANEYIDEHYKHVFGEERYFDKGVTGPFVEENYENHPKEPVYDGRKGVLRPTSSGDWELLPASFEEDGFTLLEAPTKVTDFRDLSQIKEKYRSELEQIVHCFKYKEEEEPVHIIVWNPMFRGENEDVTNVDRDMSLPNPPTSPTAGMVHVDQDVGAYDVEDILGLIKNNRLIEEDGDVFSEITDMINEGHRFCIINFWRNAGTEPIRRQPLAVMRPEYNSTEGRFFPQNRPDPETSRWYTFPEMNPDELLVFKQYDRDGSHPSDVWHCALKAITDENAPPRESFDIRVLVVFSSKVDPEMDRFSSDRVRPILNQEESGEFCNEQAKKKKEKLD